MSLALWILNLIGIISLFLRDDSIIAFPLLGLDSDCGGVLNAQSGVIKSPGYPQSYPRNKLCIWTIRVPDVNSTIKLSFHGFSLERQPNCRYDYILIRDGDSQLAPILGKFCGVVRPTDIVSKSNKLWIRFYSDSAITGQGFIANYTQSKDFSKAASTTVAMTTMPGSCGKRLDGTSGEIESPNVGELYTRVLRCVWLIDNEDPHYVIEMNFNLLHISENQQCLFDYVMIEDISGRGARTLGRFCGSALPSGKIIGQKLRVTYRLEDISRQFGFKLKWVKKVKNIEDAKSQVCGATDISTTGFLRSKNYPNNYENNLNCKWRISAPVDSMKIQLRFSSFSLEPNTDCFYDTLTIYDGTDEESPLLGRFCGQQMPGLIETTQKHMYIVFETDSSDTASGFEALWIAVVNSSYVARPRLQTKPRGPGRCGGRLTSSNGTLTSPNYPSKYPSNIECTWVITADSKHQVKLNFKSFEIEKHQNCIYDKISIRDGDSPESRLINQGCGDNKPTGVVSKSGSLWIRFSSDGSKERRGFSANWQFLAKSGLLGCGHVFHSESGELSSPNYPNAKEGRKYCSWKIRVPSHKRIKLTLKDINMAASASCLDGYIQVFDGDSNEAPELGRFCQEFLPRPITSSSNRILIGYQPDGNSDSRGFKLEWHSISGRQDGEKPLVLSATPCNRTLTKESGKIILQRGIRKCKWVIKPSIGRHITLSVVKANIIPNPGCNLERLYIHNGFTSTAPLLMKICEPTQATSATSFTNVLRIEYELLGQSNQPDVILQWDVMKENAEHSTLTASCGTQKVPLPEDLFTLAKPGMLPWMAALYSGSGVVYCGASILTQTWLVTAAHCLKRYPFYAFRKIAIGDLSVFDIEPMEQLFDIKLFHIHPGYNSSTQENDIALIKIEGKIAFNNNIGPICLPKRDTITAHYTQCLVAGWGSPTFLGKPTNRLFIGRIPIIPASICNSTSAYNGHITDSMLCAGSRLGGVDTCHGDGGGPLACKMSDGQFMLAGVTSWGNGCGYPGRYGVYTDVRAYAEWIYGLVSN